MSDTFTTPAAPAPSAPSAPGPTDIPIPDQGPGVPNPATGQAPVRQEGAEPRKQTRREGIQEAFRRFEKQRGEVKPAEAKPGHNHPPEETPRERAKPVERERPALDLRKRPDDQPKADATPPSGTKPDATRSQPRAEHGHFASHQPAQPPATDPNDPAANRYAATSGQYRDPPARWADHAKADWGKTPESVRGEVHRMHHEFDRAYQTYRADHEQMNRLRPFAELARQNNTTIDKALDNYLGMEMKLADDLFAGLDHIVNNLNLTTKDGSNRRVTFGDVAWSYVNQTPEQRQMIQQRNAAEAHRRQLQQANERIADLEQREQQRAHQAQFMHLRGGVAQYAKGRPRFTELAGDIAREISFGYDLDTAYRRAEMLRPAPAAQTRTHAPQTRTDGPAAQTRTHAPQTRTPDRSISGAPGGPSNGNGAARPAKPVSRRDAIQHAIRQNGGVPN